MGNAPSHDGFAGVLPSGSAAKVSGEAPSASKSTVPGILTGSPSVPSSLGEPSLPSKATDRVPLSLRKLEPPGHALELDEPTCAGRVPVGVDQEELRFLVPESVRKSRTLASYADMCSEILSGFLYVSNLRVARDATKLRELGITHVVNCCGELHGDEECDDVVGQAVEPLDLPEGHELRLLLRDDANEDLLPFLPEVMQFIAACRHHNSGSEAQGVKVLVHCHQGISRSCALVIAYIMLEQRVSFHEAAALVKRQRAISSPNSAFICQLIEWEKELQALTGKAGSVSSTLLSGLYRLAPHAKYDIDCLVLKRCFEPRLTTVKQRQGVMNMQEADAEHRWLWSQGTFVFQRAANPQEIVIWHGSQCKVPQAMAVAREKVEKLLYLETLARASNGVEPITMEIVEVEASPMEHPDPDVDHFGYAEELKWIVEQPAESLPGLEVNGRLEVVPGLDLDEGHTGKEDDQTPPIPQLFILEELHDTVGAEGAWDQLTNYDSEDLTPDAAFLLCSLEARGLVQGYVWLGASCSFPSEKVVVAALAQVQLLLRVKDSSSSRKDPPNVAIEALSVEHQHQESDAFWQLFEAGY